MLMPTLYWTNMWSLIFIVVANSRHSTQIHYPNSQTKRQAMYFTIITTKWKNDKEKRKHFIVKWTISCTYIPLLKLLQCILGNLFFLLILPYLLWQLFILFEYNQFMQSLMKIRYISPIICTKYYVVNNLSVFYWL
jgi:hypothetical protein